MTVCRRWREWRAPPKFSERTPSTTIRNYGNVFLQRPSAPPHPVRCRNGRAGFIPRPSRVPENLGRVEDGRGGSRGCSVSPPRSSNRTCGFPASGSPTGFTMKHTESSFASPYSSLGSFRSTTVFSGCAPITEPRFLHKYPEVRALPSAGITRLRRYYDPLRVPAGPLSLPRALELASTRSGVPPMTQTTFLACRAHYPGGPEPVRTSVSSRPVLPSPLPVQAACQLPDLLTTIWVGLSPTGDLRRWGALRNAG